MTRKDYRDFDPNLYEQPQENYPNDGSPKGRVASDKIQTERQRRLFNERFPIVQERLKKNKIQVTVANSSAKHGGLLYLQFPSKLLPPFPDGTRYKGASFKKSLTDLVKRNLYANVSDLQVAENQANLLATVIQQNRFKWEDYWFWLPKHLREQYKRKNKPKTIGELIQTFEDWFWSKYDKRDKEQVRKGTNAWKDIYYNYVIRHLQSKLNQVLSDEIIKMVVEKYSPNTHGRKVVVAYLKTFLNYSQSNIVFDFTQYKESRKYEKKKKYIPSDKEIDEVITSKFGYKQGKRTPQYRWLLGMMAVYGLRNHEGLRIKNLREPYTYIDKNGRPHTLPAFLDKSVENPAIYVTGKTGDRVCPLPLHAEWIDKWELRDFDNIPVWDELGVSNKTFLKTFTRVLRERGIPFVPYSLRHAYAHRCERLKVLPNTAATFMGHSLEMHSTVYHSNKTDAEKIALAESILKDVNEQEKLEKDKDRKIDKLQWEVRKLNQEIEKLRAENERLKNLFQSEGNFGETSG